MDLFLADRPPSEEMYTGPFPAGHTAKGICPAVPSPTDPESVFPFHDSTAWSRRMPPLSGPTGTGTKKEAPVTRSLPHIENVFDYLL